MLLVSKTISPTHKSDGDAGYTYAYAAVSPLDGVLDTLILPGVNGVCMQIFVDEIASRHAEENILMVADGAG